MGGMLEHLDGWIIDRIQAVSDRVHALTGYDSLHQARAMLLLQSISFVWMVLETRYSFNVLAAIMAGVGLYQVCFDFGHDALIRSICLAGYRNPWRIEGDMRIARLVLISWVVMVAPIMVAFLPSGSAGIFCIWLRSVLIACDVQTPRSGWIRNTLKKLRETLRASPEPVPA